MRGQFTVRGAAVAAAAGLACVVSTTAWAQQTTIVTPPAATPVVRAEKPEYNGPNRALISTGLVTFGLSYVPAVIVAGTSPQAADNHLYIPVAGPWMDLADRPACGGAMAATDYSSNIPSSIPCDAETTNKVLLGVDGVFQGIGALTTLVGLLSPEREEEPVMTAKPTVHVTPARMGVGGYGISAFGNF